MIIYQNTFENILALDCDFPQEDQYYSKDNLAVVVDGITRDPIGESDFSIFSREKMLKQYPRPSGAEMAARAIVDCFKDFNGDLKKQLSLANKKVEQLNKKYITKCDYLQNDYYGAVASCAYIVDNILYYAYICDCGIIVYNQNGDIKFQTQDDKEVISDPYINKIGIPWNLPEARVIVRKDYRNNLNNIQDGKCVSYGAITGEESALEFIKYGEIELSKGDIVVVYTDGITNYLRDESFINSILNFEEDKFIKIIERKAKEDYEKYGKEKTLIIMK